jgi:hypothetical protein
VVNNEQVTFTATVAPNALTTVPIGTVTFTIDGVAQTPVVLSTKAPFIATLSTSFSSVGTHSVSGTFSSGDPTYTGSTSPSVTVTVAQGKAATPTSVTANPTTGVLGSSITLTATVTATTAGTLTGPVTFTTGGVTIGEVAEVSLARGDTATATLTVNATTLLGFVTGTDTITATYGGDTLNVGSSGTTTRAVELRVPTLSFAHVGNQVYGGAPFAVSASSASTGAVTYTVGSGPATVSGARVTLTGVGTLVLSASQAATADYAAATAATSFIVTAELPTLSFAPIANQVYGGAPFAVSASSASTGAVTYTVVSGPATVAGAVITLTGVGTVALGASQAATADYAAATAATSFTVSAEVPTLSFAPIANQTFGVAPFVVAATSLSNGTLVYAIISGPATLSGSTVTLTGPGTVVLGASQAASGNFAAATATASFAVATPFTLTPTGGTGTSGGATTTPGEVATFSLALTPGSAGKFPDPITFTATGLPSGATATFSPATIAAGSAATTVVLTVQTSSQSAHSEKPLPGGPFIPEVLGLLLPLLAVKSAQTVAEECEFAYRPRFGGSFSRHSGWADWMRR